MTPCPFRLWMPALLAIFLGAASAQAADRHGLSAFDVLKYPADFKHFEWVNPDAPKGGRLALIGPAARTTFDNLNGFILKGDAAQGLDLLFDSLMTRSPDEPDAVYGLVAHSAELAPDRSSVTFRMRPEAKFADGTAVTSADVVFSFDTLKTKGHPNIRGQLRDIASAVAVDAHTVRFDFTGALTRDLPLVAAGLPILSKAYYATREFDQTTLDPPLGSGPYKVGEFNQGSFVSYRRREDYWGKDLPVNRGRFNFDEVRYLYYRDRSAELLALQAGEFDLREEFTAVAWVTGYDVPAVKAGKLLRLALPDESPSGAQGFFLNTRRPKLADVRVRKALDYVFDFEFANKSIFQELYTRTESFFENSPMKATGKPSAEELALLEPFKASLPPEVFDEPYRPPVSDGSGKDRKLLQAADKLLNEAGWTVKNGARVNPKGEAFDLEFLIVDPVSERVLSNYVENLKRLGLSHQHPPRRPRAIPAASEVVRFRCGYGTLQPAPHARRRAQKLLEQRNRQHGRQLEPGRHQQSRHRCSDRQGRWSPSPAPSSRLPRALLIGSCALATTGCPNGTNRSTILPIGTGFPVRP